MVKLSTWLTGAIKSRDTFGHPIDVRYKGRETHNSVTGGILTLMLQIFTGILTITSLIEVFKMNEPKIVSYTKPLSVDDRAEITPVSFKDYNYVLA